MPAIRGAHSGTQGNVLDNLKVRAAHELYVVVKICLAIDLFFTTMLYLFPMHGGFDILLFGVCLLLRLGWGWRSEVTATVVVGVARTGDGHNRRQGATFARADQSWTAPPRILRVSRAATPPSTRRVYVIQLSTSPCYE